MNFTKSQLAVRLLGIVVAVASLSMGSGCASTSSMKAEPLKVEADAWADLSDFSTVTVLPFSVDEDTDQSIGYSFSDNVAARLRTDFGQLFDEVNRAEVATGSQGELVVSGQIDKHKKGSRVARAILIGLGRASLQGSLLLSDGYTGAEVMTAPISKLWAWGGVIGASKGIEDMVAESEAAVAATIAKGKGWTPPEE